MPQVLEITWAGSQCCASLVCIDESWVSQYYRFTDVQTIFQLRLFKCVEFFLNQSWFWFRISTTAMYASSQMKFLDLNLRRVYHVVHTWMNCIIISIEELLIVLVWCMCEHDQSTNIRVRPTVHLINHGLTVLLIGSLNQCLLS